MNRSDLVGSDVTVVCGIWKFGSNILPEQLAELAKEWASASDGKRYVSLYVRKCSKTQHGIDFIYVLLSNGSEDDQLEEYKKFFYRMSDILKRKFGNDLVGWDIASSDTSHFII